MIMESNNSKNIESVNNDKPLYGVQHIFQQTYDKALEHNEVQTKRWIEYQNDHKELSTRLLSFRDELSQAIMVPIGKKALMRGNLVHTNEILVCLGDGWFVKQSAKQAVDICQRRIQSCDEMLQKLEKEKELLTSFKSIPEENEAFGKADCQEIIEPYNEEDEMRWRERHRQKEKEHRQKLAELRKARKTEVVTEEDLFHLLDELDLEEEIKDELDRMNKDSEEESSEEDTDNVMESTSSSESDTAQNVSEFEDSKSKSLKRRVSFKEDNKNDRAEYNVDQISTDDDIVKIIFTHSANLPAVPEIGNKITSPADIYKAYQKNKMPKSILKTSPARYGSEDDEDWIQFSNDNTIKNVDWTKREIPNNNFVQVVGEVVEHSSVTSAVAHSERPASRFKVARIANKK